MSTRKLMGLFFGLLLPVVAHAYDLGVTAFLDPPEPDGRVVAGGLFTYQINLINADTPDHDASPADSQLDVTVDANATVVSGSLPPGCTFNDVVPPNRKVTCSLGAIAADALRQISFQLRYTAAVPGSITVASTATLSSASNPGGEENGGDNNLGQNTTVYQGANLSLSLAAAPSSVAQGSLVALQYTVGNVGPNIASGGVRISNTLPGTLTYVSSSGPGWDCSGSSGQTVTCARVADLASGATADVLTVNARLDPTVAVGSTVTNTASVASATGMDDGDSSDNTASANISVIAGSVLALSKTLNTSPAIAGQAVSFTLTPSVQGSAATGTQIVDTLPAGFVYQSGVGTNWTCNAIGQTVLCTRTGSYAPGDNDPVTLTATAPAAGSYNNNATFSASGPNSPTSANASRNVTVLPSGADLRLSKTKSPTPVLTIASPITSTITVTNYGPVALPAGARVTVTDNLVAEEDWDNVSPVGWTCSALVAPKRVECYHDMPALTPLTVQPAAGSSLALVLTTTANAVPAGGNLTNDASVAISNSAVTDYDNSNDSGSGTVRATVNSADLGIVKTLVDTTNGDTTLATGENSLTYRLVVTNHSATDTANTVNVTDTIPMYFNGGAGYTTGLSYSVAGCSNSGADVACSVGPLGPGASATIDITVTRPVRDGTFDNTATVSSPDTVDPGPTPNQSTHSNVTIDPIADVEMVSKVIAPAPSATTPRSGTNVTYTLNFINRGPSTATGVVVTDQFTLPGGDPGFDVISVAESSGVFCTAPSSGNGWLLTCNVGNLPSGVNHSVVMVIRPKFATGNGDRLFTNNATISTTSTQPAGGGAADSKPGSITIRPALLDLVVNKADVVDPIGYDATGTYIDYDITVRNEGPSYATGVSISDKMIPPNNRIVAFTGLQAGDTTCSGPPVCTPSGFPVTGNAAGSNIGSVTCGNFDLVAGASCKVRLRYEVQSAPAVVGDTYNSNVAAVASASSSETAVGADSNTANNSEGETTTVRVKADISVSKTPSLATVQLRQPFLWTIEVNNGPTGGDSQVTTLSDTLPAGMQFITPAIAAGLVAPYNAAPYTSGAAWSNTNLAPGSGTCTVTGSAIACNFGKLEAGKKVTLTIPVRMTSYPSGGTSQNCATATTSEVDPASGNNLSICSSITVQRSSLTGFVYHDVNDDGSMGGESGIDSVNVRLTGIDAYGNAVDTTVATAGGGIFIFSDLSPSGVGDYTLSETQPTGYVDGLDNKAGTVLVGSKLTDTISAIVLPGNTAATGYLFGERVEVGISGFVWYDADNDGNKDAGETVGIRGVSIRLTGTDDLGQSVDLSTTTSTANDTGAYSFAGVRPGTYILTETHPTAWVDGIDQAGTGATTAGTAGNDTITGIVLSVYGQTAINYNFGELGGSLAGRVYHDGNGNGTRQPEEPGISGVNLTLVGTDANGQPVSRSATTGEDGSYSFAGLPVPNATGYSIGETQPGAFTDGIDKVGTLGGNLGNDVVSNILFPAAGASGTGYDFGEVTLAKTSIAGRVWLDKNGNATFNSGTDKVLAGWIVELVPNNTTNHATATVLASTTTDASGIYLFPDVTVGPTYEIRFRDPVSQAIFGKPQDGNQITTATPTDYITLRVIPVAGTPIINMNLPVDPSGVVYDALTRQPVAGATVLLDTDPAVACAPAAFDPALHLIGGTTAATQVTGADGLYQFLLTPNAPTCRYRVRVTVYPSAYVPAESAFIPRCANTLDVVGSTPPALVQPTANPSLAAAHNPALCATITDATFLAGSVPDTTRYYQTFDMSGSITDLTKSRGVIQNHIPLDPLTSGVITVLKRTPLLNVSKGDLVPYTVTFTNNLSATIPNIQLRDQIPPGFKYKTGTATLGGCAGAPAQAANEPAVVGRDLSWGSHTFTANECKRVKLLLVVGAGVGEGEYTNLAWARHMLAGSTISNTAAATVRVVPDPTFDCSDLIGKVFDDQNANGYQDEGEPGIANVRIATARGLLVTTDKDGRFHVACADIPQAQRGSNFIMKLDERSLPSGYRITTENPREVRTTRGKMVKLNFGAAIHRVVRLELSDAAFLAGKSDAAAALAGALEKLPATLRVKPSVVRLAYQVGKEDVALAKDRLRAVRERLEELWKAQGCCYTLVFEEEIFERAATKKGGAK